MVKNRLCPACHHEKSVKLYAGKYTAYECNDCSLVFLWPLPTQRQLDDFYAGQKVLSIGLSDDNINEYIKNKQNFWTRYRTRLNLIQKYKAGGSILDIGSAGGIFLDYMQHEGYEVEGIEPSDSGVASAKRIGIPTIHGMFDKVKVKKSKYDVVTWFDVIEHITNPQEQISKIHNLLKQDGILYITTPNVASLYSKLLRSRWPMYCPPEHLILYSAKSLSQLLEGKGFMIKKVRTRNAGLIYLTNLTIFAIIGKNPNGIWGQGKSPVVLAAYIAVFIPALVLTIIAMPFMHFLKLGEGLEVIAMKTDSRQG